jgi:4-amino-4-deoxy-L-arabinose transferase-like glycosyltransferase
MTRSNFPLLAVVVLSLGLNATAISWGLPSRFAWAPDELQPPIILQGIAERFSGDWHQPAYPPFHYYLLAVSYLPVLALDAVDVHSVPGRTLFYYLGRILSLVMGVGILVSIHAIAVKVFDRRSAVFSTLVAAFTVPFVYYSKTANLDVPAAFWVLLSMVFFLRHVDNDSSRDLLCFIVTAVIATCTKDQAYAFYVAPVAIYLVRRYRRGDPIFDRARVMGAAVAAASFLTIHNVVFNFWGFIHHFEEILWARDHYTSFEGTLSQLGLLKQSLIHLRFALGWPMAVACAIGVAQTLRERSRYPAAWWLLVFALSYYVFFIAPVRSTWLRYILPLALIGSIFAGRALARLWEHRLRWYRAGIVVALGYSFGYAASIDVLLLQDSRYEVERWLKAHAGADDIVGFVGPEYYLPRLDGLPARRIRATQSVLDRSRPDYLVVNPDYASRFGSDTREGELFTSLAAGRAGYGLALSYRSRPKWVLVSFDGVLGNIAKVNPLIEVYERAQ